MQSELGRRSGAAASASATGGNRVGGITGALIGMGIPELEAKQYEGKIKGGNILLSVHVDDSAERARAKKILEEFGATDIATTGEKSPPSSRSADSTPTL